MSVPRRAMGVEASRFGGDFVVLDGQGRTLRGFNATGARIFELVDGQRTDAEIAQLIASEFDVGLDIAEPDVRAFLGELSAQGLILYEHTRPTPEGPGVTP